MTTRERQITESTGQCGGGHTSRRGFGQRLLRIAGSVPVVWGVMRRLGIPAEAHEIVRAPRKDRLCCSFCNKDQDTIKQLVAGPAVLICNECVELCHEIIADDNRFVEQGGAAGQ